MVSVHPVLYLLRLIILSMLFQCCTVDRKLRVTLLGREHTWRFFPIGFFAVDAVPVVAGGILWRRTHSVEKWTIGFFNADGRNAAAHCHYIRRILYRLPPAVAYVTKCTETHSSSSLPTAAVVCVDHGRNGCCNRHRIINSFCSSKACTVGQNIGDFQR